MIFRINTPTPNSSIDAHVGDRDAALEHQLLLQRIDRADAEQVELVGADRGAGMVAEQPVEAAFAAQKGRRHAVHVAGLRRLRRVVVGMGIEPQHEQRPALLLPVARNAVHRSHRQRMIAAHEDRNGAGTRQRIGALAELADPALDRVVIFGVRRRRALVGSNFRLGHVAVVLDGKAELIEDAADARGAQRVRPHQGSELRSPDLDGDAEQGDAGSIGFRHEAAFR